MQFLPTPLSIAPSTGTLQASLSVTQDVENYAEYGADQGGLFALVLSQLSTEAQVASPVADVWGPDLRRAPTNVAVRELPLTGKPLPVVVPEAAVTVLPPRPTSVAAAMPDADAGNIPVPAPVPRLVKPTAINKSLPIGNSPLPLTPASVPLQTPSQAPASLPLQTPSLAPAAVTLTPQPTVATALDTPITAPLSQPELAIADKRPVAEIPDNSMLRASQQTDKALMPALSMSSPPVNPATQAPAASASPLHAFTLNRGVADPQWGNELGKRLIWMNDNGIGRAELRMNPPELGPVEVRIVVSNDDARVAFHVQHGATRDALEAAMPRLREMFASQGLNLADANVSEQPAQGQPGPGQSGADAGTQQSDAQLEQHSGELSDAPDHVLTKSVNGLIDTYV